MFINKRLIAVSVACAVTTLPQAAMAQSPRLAAVTTAPAINNFAVTATNTSYADMADLVVSAPLIVDVTIRKLTKVPAAQAVGVPAHLQRHLVEADVGALLRGVDGIGGKIRFLLDMPLDAKGKLPKLKKQRYFLFATKVANMPGTIRLVKPNALAEWSTNNDSLVRAITREAVQVNVPQAITGISNAFHSAGSVPGEGDTQIFLSSDRRATLFDQRCQPFGSAQSVVSLHQRIDRGRGKRTQTPDHAMVSPRLRPARQAER